MLTSSLLAFGMPATASEQPEKTLQGQGKVSSNVHGPLGESYMDNYFAKQEWKKIEGEVGRNGFDGLYVQRGKNGEIKKVMVAESKYGQASLGAACGEQQMTHAWTLCKLNALDKHLEKKIESLEKKVSNGVASNKEIEELQKLKKSTKDLKQVRKHVEHENYRRRIFRNSVKNGELRIDIKDVNEVNGRVVEKIPDGRGQVEKGGAPKATRVISLKHSPTSGEALDAYNAYFDQIEEGLKKGSMPKKEARQAVEELKLAYKKGEIINSSGSKGQAKFLRDKIVASLEKQIANETNFVARNALKARKSMLIAGEKMGGIIAPDWFMHGMDQFQKKHIQRLYKYKTVKYVKGILTQGGKLLVSIPAEITAGAGAGLISFAFDAGSASMDYAKGTILRPEFERKLGDAAVIGGVVGTGTGVAVLLGASPIGLVVIGIGVGGYMITDLIVEKWHHAQDQKYLTADDLAVFGLTMQDTIPLNMDKWDPNILLNMENWRE